MPLATGPDTGRTAIYVKYPWLSPLADLSLLLPSLINPLVNSIFDQSKNDTDGKKEPTLV